MPDIKMHREHHLGLAKARKVAEKWAAYVDEEFDMKCSTTSGKTSDTIEFVRSGVKGRLIVAADHFDLDAKLGFLLGAFAGTIERKIEHMLDELLAKGEAEQKKPAAKKAARKH